MSFKHFRKQPSVWYNPSVVDLNLSVMIIIPKI
jgi:hypothetical protein